MKRWKRRLFLMTVLTFCLTACAPKPAPIPAAPTPTEVPTAVPIPMPTPTPDPALTPAPGGSVMDRLEALLDGDRWLARFWIFPGSGPVSVELPEAEYGEALRELLASYDWQLTEAPGYDGNAVELPGTYRISIYPRTASGQGVQPFYFNTYDPVLHLSAWQDSGDLFFAAPGAEELCEAIAGLWPGWEAVTGCRTRIPPQETKAALARAYLEATFDKLREKGHITDARIDSVEIIPPVYDGESVGSNYMTYDDSVSLQFRAAFSLKPSRPELTYWQEMGADGDGWVGYELSKISLELWDDGLYQLGWFEFEEPVIVP